MIGLSAEPQYPASLGEPTAGWIFSTAMPTLWVLLAVVVVVHTVRRKRFSVLSLLFLAGTTMFWIEWPADWGSYLVYNRNFPLFRWWTSTWYQTYWKPVAVVFGYGLFFGLDAVILTYAVPAIKRAFKNVNGTLVVVVASAIIFYAFDIVAEKSMTSLGWYSYAEPVGPSWFGDKGNLSFVWPAVPFVLFGITQSLMLDRVGIDGVYPNERWFGVDKLQTGARREVRRLLAWVVTLNVMIFVFQPLILVLGRVLFLHDSVYNP